MKALIEAFQREFHREPAWIGRAPGRVNLLGEHVDYNDGPVLPVAIDRDVQIAGAPSPDGYIHLFALDLDKKISINLAEISTKKSLNGQPLPHWAHYPAGVAWASMERGLPVAGIQAVYTSSVPVGAGLSSSAAVEVAFAVLWQAIGEWNLQPLDMARLCQQAENSYVGVACGLMDQFASACGVKDHALYFDTHTLEWQPAPLPKNYEIVIADSGIRRSLANSAYNERRASCEEAVEILKRFLPGIRSLRNVRPTEFAAYSAYLPTVPRKRAEHVIKEIARVESALLALGSGNIQSFGALMFAGHASLRDLYEVSTAELDRLVEIARSQTGCIGARLTGAGFGGCTVNLVKSEHVPRFIHNVSDEYLASTGREAQIYVCKASAGASAFPVERLILSKD